jgi:hypothetical protein
VKTLSAAKTAIGCFLQLCIIASLLIFIVIYPTSVQAQYKTYTEDFTTTTYRDADNTTALWDTEKGEISLAPFRPFKVGAYDTDGSSYKVAVSGNHVYVADYDAGVVVVDITNVAKPVFAGEYPMPQKKTYDLVVDGDWLYVVNGAGLVILNIQNPTEPVLSGSIVTGGVARGIAIAGQYAFVGAYDKGLVVIDISDKASPFVVDSYDTDGQAHGVAVSGNYAFVADYQNGLVVIDITDPTSPQFAGGYYIFGGHANDVCISGDLAYVANGNEGLLILDILDPSQPTPLGSFTTDYAHGITIDGDHAYVADSQKGLVVIDVQEPSEPKFMTGYDSPGKCYGVVIDGIHAYVASGSAGLEAVQISCPVKPHAIANLNWSDANAPCGAIQLAILGDYLYVASTNFGLQVIRISDPIHPLRINSNPEITFITDFKIDGNYGYICADDQFKVIDLTDPVNPVVIASLTDQFLGEGPLFMPPVASAIRGDYCFVRHYLGLDLLNIENPQNPTVINNPIIDCYGCESRGGIAIEGDFAYTSMPKCYVMTMDIGDPQNSTVAWKEEKEEYPYESICSDFIISGNYAYSTKGSYSDLQVINIADPLHLKHVGECKGEGYNLSMVRSGDYLYLGTSNALDVIDISDPTHPILIERVGLNMYFGSSVLVDGVISGDLLFAANLYKGLDVIRIGTREFQSPCVAQSKWIDFKEQLLGAQLLTEESEKITWQLSSGHGAPWLNLDESMGCRFTEAVKGVFWRAALSYREPVNRTACSQLEIRPLYDYPMIDRIRIDPGYRKSKAFIHFTRSAYDFESEIEQPLQSYAIYRWVDDDQLAQKLIDFCKQIEMAVKIVPGILYDNRNDKTHNIGWQFVQYQGKPYLISAAGRGMRFPAAAWQFVSVVPASHTGQYEVQLQIEGRESKSSRNLCYVVATDPTLFPNWAVCPIVLGGQVNNIPTVYKELLE